jgi:hypothetical protein
MNLKGLRKVVVFVLAYRGFGHFGVREFRVKARRSCAFLLFWGGIRASRSTVRRERSCLLIGKGRAGVVHSISAQPIY